MFDCYLNDYDYHLSGHTSDGPDFEEMLALAAGEFPVTDGLKPEDNRAISYAHSAPSPFTGSSSSGSSLAMSPPCYDGDDDSDDDGSDSDVEHLSLDDNYDLFDQPPRANSPSPFEEDAPYLPKRSHPSPTAATASSLARGRRPSNSRPPPAIIRSSPSPQPTLSPAPSISVEDPDQDVEEESDGDATDDEYVPSPALSPLKRRRRSPTVSKRPTKRSVSPVSSTTSISRPTKRARLPPPSRNRQVTSEASLISLLEEALASKRPDFTCPACGRKQENQRLPDYKRHLRTHMPSLKWSCKGVLVEDAACYGISKTTKPYMHRNEWRVGGCMQSFSRRDALKRHLDNDNVLCIGDSSGAAEEC